MSILQVTCASIVLGCSVMRHHRSIKWHGRNLASAGLLHGEIEFLRECLEWRCSVCRRTRIVAQHDSVSIRTYQCHLLVCSYRQQVIIVLQQGDGLLCRLQCQRLILLAFESIADRVCIVIKLTKSETRFKHSDYSCVYISLR